MKLNGSFQVRTIESVIAFALIAGQSSYLLAQDPWISNPSHKLAADSGRPELPDSPGAVQVAQSNATAQPTGGSQEQVTAQEQQQAPASQGNQQQQPSTQQQPTQQPAAPREPVGTAAAETVPTTGIAASRPAGAALAPAKQRRVRSILIKVGALAGAAAAIGTTVALSQGSPSKPPGAR